MKLYLDNNGIFWIDNRIITDKIEFIQATDKKFNIRKLSGESLLPISTEFYDMDQFTVEKENNSIYANTGEIILALQDYLLISSGVNPDVGTSKDGWIRLIGNGETNYAAPEDLDVDGFIAAWNPMDVEVLASNIEGVDTIVFTIAPEVDEFPLVRYTKK